MPAPAIRPYRPIVPMIYAYTTPGVASNDGWIKIGYTEKYKPAQRIAQQTHTAGIPAQLEWQDNAMYKDGTAEYFTDRTFHAFLTRHRGLEQRPRTEWFRTDSSSSRHYFEEFALRQYAPPVAPLTPYALREEQEKAVAQTAEAFRGSATEFLWNAKPRFGKTLAVYELALRMGFRNVLVLTNRPSVANSWADDFHEFFDGGGKLVFVSDNPAVAGKPGVLSRGEFVNLAGAGEACMVAFESLQGLKGSVYFGGEYDKLEWLVKERRDRQGRLQQGLVFDLLVLDESQEGVDTFRTDVALRQIARKHTLFLSGTPFKALASARFPDRCIFNWSYADEQARKAEWHGDGFNPYETLPRLALFTYRLSPMIREAVERGMELDDGKTVDVSFGLNEFFRTDGNGAFVHLDSVRKFVGSLSTGEKYPFSTPELREALPHTLWLLDRVASAKALKRLLETDPVFREYHIVLAVGDGRNDDDDPTVDAAFDRVREAVRTHPRTITLSVGQLTVGVTVPEWCGVLMLCNLSSPSAYMQAAFRAQNPGTLRTGNGRLLRKETAYVFDFDPARTLVVFDEFANNLRPPSGGRTTADRAENIRRLLNFFPVVGEDPAGRMVELDAAAVLSIPRRLKSSEVVRKGFMSNYLFSGISNVFHASEAVRQILAKLSPPREGGARASADLDAIGGVEVDDAGNAVAKDEIVIGTARELFGPKLYADIDVPSLPADGDGPDAAAQGIARFAESLKEQLADTVVAPVATHFGLGDRAARRLEAEISRDVDASLQVHQADYERKAGIARVELDRVRETAESPEEIRRAEEDFKVTLDEAFRDLRKGLETQTRQIVENKPRELVERLEQQKAEAGKRAAEDDIRAHLRGFSRTIPSFIMAYGEGERGGITLANFDAKTEPDVFREVTSITVEEFRFLRDGGDWTDPATGIRSHFEGHLFDETVFDDSVAEFWNKKTALADYFDESLGEDIFDYIPPQKTNQIFTPRAVVRRMVDLLEAENPGCFDDPDRTFADLYMKSGLFIAEIVKRLYRSPVLKKRFPTRDERIRHILTRQVYGLSPTRIIHLIATHYILGFPGAPDISAAHFRQADASAAARDSSLPALLDSLFPD